MRSRIKTETTLVYQGGKGKLNLVKKSTTEAMISKYYELSDELEPRAKLKDAWAMYKAFKLRVEFNKLELGL